MIDTIISNINLLVLVPTLNVELLLNGIMIGAIFALAAYGLALVWGVMNVKNLAQGELVIMGGYIAYYMYSQGINPLFALPVAVVFMFGFGWVMYYLIIRHIVGRDLFTTLLATFGMGIVIQQVLNLIFGPEVQTARSGLGTIVILGNVTIQEIRIVSLCIAAVLALGIVLFMKKSRMGQAIRATAQDPRAARVMGINTDRVYAFTFSLNSAICGAAGVLIGMIWIIQPFYGIPHSIRSFVIVVAAGLGNLPGVIVSALGLGVLEQYGGFVLGAEYQQAVVVGMLVVVLVIRQILQARHRQVVQ
jgi:branched-chain amino acid transport system permease protein